MMIGEARSVQWYVAIAELLQECRMGKLLSNQKIVYTSCSGCVPLSAYKLIPFDGFCQSS